MQKKKKMEEETNNSKTKKEVMAMTTAAIERLGSESPAREMASDTHLMRFFAESFLVT